MQRDAINSATRRAVTVPFKSVVMKKELLTTRLHACDMQSCHKLSPAERHLKKWVNDQRRTVVAIEV
jgi:hypothetical protein